MKRLLDQVAVVTGGGTGIGRGVALALSIEYPSKYDLSWNGCVGNDAGYNRIK